MKKVTKVKICGLSEEEHMLAAGEAGADFIGLMFAPSTRQITPERAAALVKTVRKLDKSPAIVGVFVNTAASEVNRIAEECDLDLVQLSGDEDWQYCLEIDRPVIKVIHISENDTVDGVIAKIEEAFNVLQDRDVMYMLDTKKDKAYGGTGESFNRHIAAGVAGRIPVIIAGGLDPENIAGVVEEVHPWAVDVSSGVETDGKKDITKIKEFISEVKAAEGG